MRRPIGLYCTRQGGTADASSSEYVRVSHCWIYRKLTFSLSCVLRTAPCMMIARRISWQHLPLAPFPFPNPTPLLFTETSLALVKKEGRQAGQTWHALGKRKVPQPNQLPIIICWGETKQGVDLKVEELPSKSKAWRMKPDRINDIVGVVLPSSCPTLLCRRVPSSS
jgi:hypothetical protein